jgi:predicted tellurium resistance membrane protein TerC
LLDLGFSQRQILGFYYLLSASFGLLGISDTHPTIKLIALGLLGLFGAAIITYVTWREGERQKVKGKR